MLRLSLILFGLALLADTHGYYTLRTPNGIQDELQSGEEPRPHLETCSAQKGRDICLNLVMQWGVQLVNRSYLGKKPEEQEETARGWRFLTLALQELRSDLDGTDVERIQVRLAVHRNMDLKITDLRAGNRHTPGDARDTALAYYFRVWDLLPAKPAAVLDFHHKFDTAEQIKGLIQDLGQYFDASAEIVTHSLRFYEQAYEFHRLPMPGGETLTESPGWQATVHEDMWFTMDAYAHLPGTAGIVPHRLLAHSDLEDRLLLLRRMARAGSIPQSTLEEVEKETNTLIRSLKIAELNRWFDLARERGDREQAIELGLKIISLQIQQGLTDEPRQELTFIREEQKQLGDLPGWSKSTLDLSTHYIKAERWREALALIEEAKPVLRDLLDAKYLEESLKYEQLVREKLKLPPPADFPLEGFKTGFDYMVRLIPIGEESDRIKRRDQLRELLAVPNAAPYARVAVAIQLLNTLQELREVDAVGQLAMQWLPEVKRWRGIPGEVNFRHVLLQSDIDRGDLGRFYASLSSYEKAARTLRGENWLEPAGSSLADVFFRLQDFRKADEMLAAHMRIDQEKALQNPVMNLTRTESYHDEDLLLQARIQLERGQKEEALATISRLEARTQDNGTGVKMNPDEASHLALQLARVNSALGRQKEALAGVKLILAQVSPLNNTQLWAEALVEQARLSMALGEPLAAQVQKIEEVVPGLNENPELSGEKAPDMDTFLADYYLQQGATDMAVKRLRRGLEFAAKVGLLDPQIIIHRKLGEVALRQNNLPGAIEEYRRSIAMLDSVSRRIPSDVGKVGYRGERNKALPLLVQALYETYRRAPTRAARDDLLDAIEAGKARAMTELLFPGKTEAPATVTLKSLQDSIPPDTAVLEFYLPEDTDQVFRVLLSRSDSQVELLNVSAEELSNHVSALRKQMTAIETFTEASFKSGAAQLARILLPGAWLASFDSIPFGRLYIVPAGPLHQYPFATLVDERGRYLDDAEKLEVACLPSAAMLMRPAPKAAEVSRSATFIGPAGEKLQHEVLEATGDLRELLREAIQQWRPGDFEWEQPLTARAFLERARNLDNVFLYAHARFLPQDPVSSYIKFAGPTEAISQLAAADLLQTKVGSGLWVLAACSTGGGRVRSGDEVMGLPRALLLAGAGMVVITFWDVDAETSFDIMVRFYTNLSKGASVAAALREARNYARKSGLQAYHWAPFVLIGNHGFRN